MGKKWHIAYADYSWGQSTRDAYAAEIKKAGGEVVGTTGIPLGTADMTPFLSKISGNFDGLFGIFFGKDGITIGNQAFDLGLTKKYKWAGDGAIAESTNLPALGYKINGFIGINRYMPVFQGAVRHALSPQVLRRGGGAVEEDGSVRPAARPLRAGELRGHERAQARHGEVEVRGPQGHDEADRGARRPADEAEATTSSPATRCCARKTIRPSRSKFIFEMKDGKTDHHADDPRRENVVPAGLQVHYGVSDRQIRRSMSAPRLAPGGGIGAPFCGPRC